MSDIFNNNDNYEDNDDFPIMAIKKNINIDSFFQKTTLKEIISNEPIKYHKQLFQYPNVINIKPIESSMYTKKNGNSDNTLRFNLCSPIFDSKFNSRQVSHIELIKNYDGSVDFVIKFDKQNKKKNNRYFKVQKQDSLIKEKSNVVSNFF